MINKKNKRFPLFSELSMPHNVEVKLKDHGIVTLEWKYPLFSTIKIIKFHIEVEFRSTDLLIEPLEKNQSIEYLVIEKEATYSKELFLSASTKYCVHINAVDYRNRTSNKTIYCFSVPSSIGFAVRKLKIEPKEKMITLQTPSITNRTRNTMISIVTIGLMNCKEELLGNFSTLNQNILFSNQVKLQNIRF